MASLGGEIISLQFGNYSNFIGTHWWNLQECGFSYNADVPGDINHDVLFREGQTNRGEITYTPRLVLSDLKGSLGTLPEEGGLYEKPPTPKNSYALWDEDKVELEVSPAVDKNEYLRDLEIQEAQMSCVDNIVLGGKVTKVRKRYKLDDSVHTWSDFTRTLYHPRSFTITNEYKFEDPDKPFNCFGLGVSLWGNPNYQEDYIDRVRAYMEECDNSQGFHVTLDGHDGFSGLACGGLQFINDEYSTKPVMAFVSIPSYFPSTSIMDDSRRIANIALTFASLPEISSLYCPITTLKEGWRSPQQIRSFPYLNFNNELNYHSSSIIASGLETLSLGYRLRNASMRLTDLTSGLKVVGRAAASASVTLPFPMVEEDSLLKTLEEWDGSLFHSISPYCNLESVDLQSICIRGVDENNLIGNIQAGTDMRNPAYSCKSVKEMINYFISCSSFPSPNTHVCSSKSLLKVYDPFPAIFDQKHVSVTGKLYKYVVEQQKGVDEVPVLAGLHSSREMSKMFKTLHCEAKRIKFRNQPSLVDAGIDVLEWEEKLEQILCLSECYLDDK